MSEGPVESVGRSIKLNNKGASGKVCGFDNHCIARSVGKFVDNGHSVARAVCGSIQADIEVSPRICLRVIGHHFDVLSSHTADTLTYTVGCKIYSELSVKHHKIRLVNATALGSIADRRGGRIDYGMLAPGISVVGGFGNAYFGSVIAVVQSVGTIGAKKLSSKFNKGGVGTIKVVDSTDCYGSFCPCFAVVRASGQLNLSSAALVVGIEGAKDASLACCEHSGITGNPV